MGSWSHKLVFRERGDDPEPVRSLKERVDREIDELIRHTV